MKIISKFKDYYDYLVGIYGEDPLLFFDRRENNPQFADLPHTTMRELLPPQFLENFDFPCLSESVLYVGNQRVWLFNTGDKIYTSFDVVSAEYERYNIHGKGYFFFLKIQFADGEIHRIYDNSWHHVLSNPRKWQDNCQVQVVDRTKEEFVEAYAKVPLLLRCLDNFNLKKVRETQPVHITINPQLSTLGVYLPEEWVWQEISAYLGQLRSEQETSPPVPDKNKIENKGFDVKHSFRPKMKRK